MNKLKRLWANLRASFWCVPALRVGGSIAFVAVLKKNVPVQRSAYHRL